MEINSSPLFTVPDGPLLEIIKYTISDAKSIKELFQKLVPIRIACKKLDALIKTVDDLGWVATLMTKEEVKLSELLSLPTIFPETDLITSLFNARRKTQLDAVTSLNLKGLPITSENLKEIITLVPNLKRLHLPEIKEEIENEDLLPKELESLSLEYSFEGFQTYNSISSLLDTLGKIQSLDGLTLRNAMFKPHHSNQNLKINQNLKHLELVNIIDRQKFNFIEFFPNLRSLIIDDCQGFGSDQASLLEKLKNLNHLTIRNHLVTASTIATFATKCPQLSHIELHNLTKPKNSQEFLSTLPQNFKVTWKEKSYSLERQ